jgi:hypothetical protein
MIDERMGNDDNKRIRMTMMVTANVDVECASCWWS